MNKENKETVPKASRLCEFPSSKVTGEGETTLSGAGVTAPAVKESLPPAIGSLVTTGPGVGISKRDASTRNIFGRQDPGKEMKYRRKKKKALKRGVGIVHQQFH